MVMGREGVKSHACAPGDWEGWISGHQGGDIKDSAGGFRDRVVGSVPESVQAELYWVSSYAEACSPRREAMFSRPQSMALLPTQVCILVEACYPLCETKAAEYFPGIGAPGT